MKYIKAAAALVTAVTLSVGYSVHAYEQVTDIMKIYAMLKEYASFNLLDDVHDVYIRDYEGEQKVFAEVYGVFSEGERKLRRYISEQQIDENKVEFLWLYRHSDEDNSGIGDANSDGKVTVRDCAYIAGCLSRGRSDVLPDCADYNGDGRINVRDAAAISKDIANKLS